MIPGSKGYVFHAHRLGNAAVKGGGGCGSWNYIQNRSGWNSGLGALSGFETQRERRAGIFNQSGRADRGIVLGASVYL